MNQPVRILYVDDYPLDRELVRDALEKEDGGFELVEAASRAEFETALTQGRFDLVLSDFNILGFEGLQVLEAVRAKSLDLPVIIVTGTGSEEVAADAIKRGAADYVIKTPKHIQRLPHTIHAVLEKKQLEDERKQAEELLVKSEQAYRTLFKNIPTGLYRTSADGRFLDANPAMVEMFGYKNREALLAANVSELYVDPTSDRKFKSAIEKAGKVSYFEAEFKRPDGTTFWTEDHIQLIRDEAGKPLFYEGSLVDITERKHAEEGLQNERNLLRTLIDNLPDSIYAKDIQGRFIVENLPLARQLGVSSPDEAIGKTDFDYFPPDLAAQYSADDQAVFRSGQPIINREETIVDATDRSGWVSTTKVPLRDPHGQVIGLVGIGHDITERKQAEEKLRQSNERFQSYFDLGLIGMAITAPSKGIMDVNEKFCEILGYERREILSKKWAEMTHPDDLAADTANFNRVVAGEIDGYSMEKRWIRKDGRVIDSNISVKCLRGDDGSISYFVSLLEDITERKQAEEAMRGSEERFRKMFEEGPIGAALSDKQYHFVRANPAFCRLLGYTEEELKGLTFKDITHPEDMLNSVEKVRELEKGNLSVIKTEKRYVMKNKQVVWGALTLSTILDPEGKFQFFLVMIEDITNRKQAEEAVRAGEQLYRNLFENMLDGFAYCKMIFEEDRPQDFIYLNINSAFETLTGLKSVVGKKVSEVIPGIRETDPELFEVYGRVALTGIPEVFETYVQALKMWFSISVYSPQKEYFVAVFDVITERKQAEEALRESESRFRGLFENSPISLWEEDFSAVKQRLDALRAEGITDFPAYFASHPELMAECAALIKVLDVNKATLKLFGANRKEELLKNLAGIFGGEPSPAFVDELTALAAGNTSFSGGMVNKTLDGRLINIELSWSADPVHQQSLSRVNLSMIDVTEHKRAEILQEAVFRIASAAVTTGSLDDLYAEIHHIISSVMNAENFYITLYDPERDLLTFPYFKDFTDEVYLDEVHPERGLTSYVLRTGKSLLCTQAVHDELERRGEVKLLGTPSSIWLGVPLIVQGQTIGAMVVQHYSDPTAYSEREQHILEYVSAQVATAINRKRAEEGNRRQLARLAALHHIDEYVSSSFDLHMTLNEILKHVKKELSVDAADVLLLNNTSLFLEYSAGLGFRTKAIEKASIRLGQGHAGLVALKRELVQIPNLQDQPGDMRLRSQLTGEDFVCYYGAPLIVKGTVKGVLEIYNRSPLSPDQEWFDFLNTLAGQTAIAIDNALLFENLERSNIDLTLAYDATIEGWSHAMDLRDKETEGHTLRVTEMTMELASLFGIKDTDLTGIRRGALLHDIGKMGVPDAILLKPDSLTEDEWIIMKKHPVLAFQMLSPIRYLQSAIDIPYCHHEKWDGTGYPRGLKGLEIPLPARIFAVVDVWDAVTSDRPYRQAWSHEKAIEYIRSQSGIHFDPEVVNVCLKSGVFDLKKPTQATTN